MPDLKKLNVEFWDLVRIGGILATILLAYSAMQRDFSLLQDQLRRIEQNDIQALKKQDEEFKAHVARIRDEATADRLRQTEILTEVRTDVRQMRQIIERLERGSRQ